jgi:hypothetical protein
LPSWPPLTLIGGALHQLEDELMSDLPLEELMSTHEQAFSLSDFLEEDLFDPGNAETMPESQSFPFAPIDVEHLFFHTHLLFYVRFFTIKIPFLIDVFGMTQAHQVLVNADADRVQRPPNLRNEVS